MLMVLWVVAKSVTGMIMGDSVEDTAYESTQI